jgi:hypothetical protein
MRAPKVRRDDAPVEWIWDLDCCPGSLRPPVEEEFDPVDESWKGECQVCGVRVELGYGRLVAVHEPARPRESAG